MGANWTARKRDFGFKVVADPAEQNEQKQYIPEEGTGYSPAVGEETCRRVRPRGEVEEAAAQQIRKEGRETRKK